jgi:hypothetical protein
MRIPLPDNLLANKSIDGISTSADAQGRHSPGHQIDKGTVM